MVGMACVTNMLLICQTSSRLPSTNQSLSPVRRDCRVTARSTRATTIRRSHARVFCQTGSTKRQGSEASKSLAESCTWQPQTAATPAADLLATGRSELLRHLSICAVVGACSSTSAVPATAIEAPSIVQAPPQPAKLLHLTLKVADQPAVVAFYQSLGMRVVGEAAGRRSVFVGFGPEAEGDRCVVEVVQAEAGAELGPPGAALDHLLLAVPDPGKAKKAALAAGGVLTRAAGGRAEAVEGPGGAKVVLTGETPGLGDPLCRVVLNVEQLEASRLFLQGLGMKVFESRSDAVNGRRSILMGYGRGVTTAPTLEIAAQVRGDNREVEVGSLFNEITVSTPDLDESMALVRKAMRVAQDANVSDFGQIVQEPSGGTAAVKDPLGITYFIVDSSTPL